MITFSQRKRFHKIILWFTHSYMYVGITVNALAPAAVRTALIEAMNLKDMIDKIPMQRSGDHTK